MKTLTPPPNSAITPEEWQQIPPSVRTWIGELIAENKQLRETVEQLQEIVNRNSQNSSQPPSQDGLAELNAGKNRERARSPFFAVKSYQTGSSGELEG